MNTKCLSEAYEKGVDEFIQYAFVKLHPRVKRLNVDPLYFEEYDCPPV